MTIRTFAMRCLMTMTIAAAAFTVAQAQPSAAGTVTPPVRADMALGGTVLSTRNVADHLACQSECKRTPGCTGYSFDRAAKANCTLLGGALADIAVRGAVSCRMPCEPGPRASVLSQRLPVTVLRDPGAVKLSVPTPLPGASARLPVATAVAQSPATTATTTGVERPVSLLPGPSGLPMRQLPTALAAGAGTSSNQAASTGTGIPPSTTLPPCPPGGVSIVGSCDPGGAGGATPVSPPPSAPAPAPGNITVTLSPVNDNTIASSGLNTTYENSVYPVYYWFATPGIGMGCDQLHVVLTGGQYLSCARGLIKFNLTSLAGKTIQSATLSLTTSAHGTGRYKDQWYVAASASAWSGSTVKWINYGDLAYIPSKTIQNPPTFVGQIFNLDQTTTVRNWLSGAYVNNGFATALTQEQLRFCRCISLDRFEFHSNEDPGGRGPKLIVTYR